MAETILVIAAALAGAILVMSVVSGKVWDRPAWQVPKIVSRSEDPRKYWSALWMTAILFALAAWFVWATFSH